MPTYLYRFDFDSERFNLMRRLSCGTKVRGACHADDLMYVFYNAGVEKPRKDTMEYLTIRRCIYILTQFARIGNPTEIIHSELNNVANKMLRRNSRKSIESIVINDKTQGREEAINENPSVEKDDAHLSVRGREELRKWLPITKDADILYCLNISDDLKVINLPESEKLKFWDLMYEDKSLLY